MKLLGAFLGMKLGLVAIILLSCYPMGIAHGSHQAPGDIELIEITEPRVTASELQQKEPPWPINHIKDHTPSVLQSDALDSAARQATVWYANTMIDTGVWLFNSGVKFGYDHYEWINPTWAMRLTGFGMLVTLVGYMGPIINLIYRRGVSG